MLDHRPAYGRLNQIPGSGFEGSNPFTRSIFSTNNLQNNHSFGITLSRNRFKDIHHCSLMFRAVEMQQWTHPIAVDNP